MNKLLALALVAFSAPVIARDDLGVFDDWGAFRDPGEGRCYAIAIPQPAPRSNRAAADYSAYASVGTWPGRGVRGQIHVRLSRKMAARPAISLTLGGRRFAMTGGGGDAWAADKAMDAAIVAAMRSAGSMAVSATDARGRRFTDRYSLKGIATALDAASLGCAGIRR